MEGVPVTVEQVHHILVGDCPAQTREEDAALDPRLANAVWDAFFGRSVTPRYYRPLADVSVATATKDLAIAVAAGLLRPVGRARSRTYQVGEAPYARIGAALGIPVTESGELARGTIIGELTKRVVLEVRG